MGGARVHTFSERESVKKEAAPRFQHPRLTPFPSPSPTHHAVATSAATVRSAGLGRLRVRRGAWLHPTLEGDEKEKTREEEEALQPVKRRGEGPSAQSKQCDGGGDGCADPASRRRNLPLRPHASPLHFPPPSQTRKSHTDTHARRGASRAS